MTTQKGKTPVKKSVAKKSSKPTKSLTQSIASKPDPKKVAAAVQNATKTQNVEVYLPTKQGIDYRMFAKLWDFSGATLAALCLGNVISLTEAGARRATEGNTDMDLVRKILSSRAWSYWTLDKAFMDPKTGALSQEGKNNIDNRMVAGSYKTDMATVNKFLQAYTKGGEVKQYQDAGPAIKFGIKV